MRRLLAIAMLAALGAIAAGVFGGELAPARHGDRVALTDRGPLCILKPDTDPDEPGTFVSQGRKGCVPAVARNLIGDGATAGKTIAVCAESDYDASTRAAIDLLNEAGFGRSLFHWAGAPASCAHETAAGQLSSVVVLGGEAYYKGTERQPSPCRKDDARTGWACVRHFNAKGAPDYAYIGQGEIRMHPDLDVVSSKDAGVEGTCEPDGTPFDVNTDWVRLCKGSKNVVKGRADGTLGLTRMIAHELLHMVGLRDYYCGNDRWKDPLGTTATLMDSFFWDDCRTPRMKDGNRADTTKAMVAAWDLQDYRSIYTPAPVEGLTATASGANLTLSWTATHVHVEKGYRVERQAGTSWQAVPGAVAGRDATSVTIAKPASRQTYRVVSLTDALTASAAWPTLTYPPPVVRHALAVSATGGGRVSVSPSPEAGHTTYRAGTPVTLTAVPNSAAHTFEGWGGKWCSGTATTCTVTMNGPRAVTAAFKVTLTTSAGAGGRVTPAGVTAHSVGAKVEIKASPTNPATHKVKAWSEDCSGSAPKCELRMNADRTAHVTFAAKLNVIPPGGTDPVPPRYTLTTSAGSGGSILPAGTTSYAKGTPVTVTASPNAGKRIASWGGNCSTTPTTDTTCELTMNGPRTARVTFENIPEPTGPTDPVPPRYTLTTTAGSGGSISPAGTTTYAKGTPVTVTASPNTGKRIASWGGNCSGTDTTDTTCELTMNGPRTASVTFENIPEPTEPTEPTEPPTVTPTPTCTLTVKAVGGGSVSGGGSYTCGPTSTATATASWNTKRYTFRGWSGDCSGTAASCTVTMTSNKSATATFDTKWCYVTGRANAGGRVTGGGNVRCDVGSSTVTAHADTGYCFDHWGGGLGRQQEAQSTCLTSKSITISKPLTDVTVIANFTRKTTTPTTYRLVVVGGSGGGNYKANTWATASAPAGKCFLGTTYTFSRWSGDSSSTSRTIRLYMNRDKSVTALYRITAGGCPQQRALEGETAPALDPDAEHATEPEPPEPE